MQAIVETLFDAVYLITVITLGVIMIVKSGPNKEYRLFGVMAGRFFSSGSPGPGAVYHRA